MWCCAVDEEDDGTSILLTVKGEEFPHTIDLDRLRASGGSVIQNIRLSGDSTPIGSGFSSACCLILFVVMALYILGKTARMLSTPAGRMEFRGYKPERYVQCPVCNIPVAHHQLTKHLIVDHDIEMFEAGQMAGKVLRGTWSTEEEVRFFFNRWPLAQICESAIAHPTVKNSNTTFLNLD